MRGIQQLWARPYQRPPEGIDGLGEEDCAQITHGHNTEIRNTGGACVINEDIWLLTCQWAQCG